MKDGAQRGLRAAFVVFVVASLSGCGSSKPAATQDPIPTIPTCNQLPRPPAAMVTVEQAPAPVLSGGTIAPGTYVLTTLQYYPPADTMVTPKADEYGQTWKLDSGRADLAERTGDTTTTAAAMYSITGTALDFTSVCNGLDATGISFDATPSQIRLSSEEQGVVVIQTLVLQPPPGG